MLKSFCAGTALALVLAACSPAPEPAKPAVVAEPTKPKVDTAKIAAAVKADLEQLVVDFSSKDVAKAVAHDSPTYIGMFHGLPNVVGPEQDAELTKQQVSDPNLKLAISNTTVDVSAAGDMAHVLTNYAYTGTDPKTKKAVTESGNWVLGYKPQADGAWKLAWAVVSDTGPAPKTPPAPAAAAPAAASAAAAPTGPVDTAKIAATVKASVEQLLVDFNAKDVAKATAPDAPNFIGMVHGYPNMIGPEGDAAMTKEMFKDPALKLGATDIKVDVAASGDMATVLAAYTMTSTDMKTKKPVTESGNWLMGYRLQPDGSWKQSWMVVSDTGPAPKPAASPAKPK